MENTTQKKRISAEELADFCVNCALEKKAEDVVKLDIHPESSIADWFVLATANSDPQLQAIVGFTMRELREKFQIRPLSESGDALSGWVVLDYGDVILHFMTPQVREKYNLEGLWGEKPTGNNFNNPAQNNL